MGEIKDGCVTPARGLILSQEEKNSTTAPAQKEVPKMTAQVGKPAPDFEVSAFINARRGI